jgi:hypothetical protein
MNALIGDATPITVIRGTGLTLTATPVAPDGTAGAAVTLTEAGTTGRYTGTIAALALDVAGPWQLQVSDGTVIELNVVSDVELAVGVAWSSSSGQFVATLALARPNGVDVRGTLSATFRVYDSTGAALTAASTAGTTRDAQGVTRLAVGLTTPPLPLGLTPAYGVFTYTRTWGSGRVQSFTRIVDLQLSRSA